MKLSKGMQRYFFTVTPLSKFIALVCFILFPFFGFYLGMQYQKILYTSDQQIEDYTWDTYKKEERVMPSLKGTYAGVLPCADCDGIDTQISFYIDPHSQGPRTFTLQQSYQGKPDEPTEYTGTWTMDEDIYQLMPDGSPEYIYFQQVDEQSIQQLDKNQKKIKTKGNYILIKQ